MAEVIPVKPRGNFVVVPPIAVGVVVQATPATFTVPGLSAYQLAVSNGYGGTEEAWLASLGNRSFLYVQSTPSASWNIPHSLGRPPSVTLLSDTGEEFDADVTATSTNVYIQLPSPITGQAILT